MKRKEIWHDANLDQQGRFVPSRGQPASTGSDTKSLPETTPQQPERQLSLFSPTT